MSGPGFITMNANASLASRTPVPVLFEAPVAEVIPGHLHVAGFRDLHDIDTVRRLRLTAFLCVAAGVQRPSFVTDDDIDSGRVAFRHMPLADNGATRFADHLPAAFAFIDAARAEGRPVAVYCQAGKSRSVSVVAAYLMREEQIDFGAAMERIRRTRPVADPNIAFCMQLQELTDALHGGGYARGDGSDAGSSAVLSPLSTTGSSPPTFPVGGDASDAQRARASRQAAVLLSPLSPLSAALPSYLSESAPASCFVSEPATPVANASPMDPPPHNVRRDTSGFAFRSAE
jgi:predicted protein tyrosine phosphatase